MSAKELVKAYPQNEANLDYNRLFCDIPELFHNENTGPRGNSWDVLFKGIPDLDLLKGLVADEKAEARLRALASHYLMEKGEAINLKEVLGVVVEVGADEGLEVLAVYRDYHARFIDYLGKMTVWETPDPSIRERMDRLMSSSRELIEYIRPWKESRLTPPIRGMVRLTFLATDGLYFGQGPISHLQKDEMGGAVIRQAQQIYALLMQIR
jgi:hypothetical protein